MAQYQDTPGQALVNPLVMLLQYSHPAGCNGGNIPVRDDNRPSLFFQHTLDLIEGIGIEPVHGIALPDTDRLAVGKIGDYGVNGMVPERQAGRIRKHESCSINIPPAPEYHHRVKIAANCVHPKHAALDEDPASTTEWIEKNITCVSTGDVDQGAGHPRHHHAGMEKISSSRVPRVISAAAGGEEQPAKITAVSGKYCPVNDFGVVQRDRA